MDDRVIRLMDRASGLAGFFAKEAFCKQKPHLRRAGAHWRCQRRPGGRVACGSYPVIAYINWIRWCWFEEAQRRAGAQQGESNG